MLGLLPVPDPVELESIEPLDRGSLVHEILRSFLAGEADADGGPARLESGEAEALRERLRAAAAAAFAATEREVPVGYPLLWKIERERILELLDRWLDRELEEAAATGLRPAEFEWDFGDPGSKGRALRIVLGDGTGLEFRGRIDRIDVDPAAGAARIVDYKTGRVPDGDPAQGIADGRGLQLPIYLMAASALTGPDGRPLDTRSALYRYVAHGEDQELTRGELRELEPALIGTLGVLAASARAGDFTADPRDPQACKYCDYRDPCGEGRVGSFGRKKDDPAVRARLALRDQ